LSACSRKLSEPLDFSRPFKENPISLKYHNIIPQYRIDDVLEKAYGIGPILIGKQYRGLRYKTFTEVTNSFTAVGLGVFKCQYKIRPWEPF
jgi:hypothetical protein